MATKARSAAGYTCSECGWTSVRWVGRCGECLAWGSVAEQGAPRLRQVAATRPASRALPIGEVSEQAARRRLTGVGELDRVLGGGVVPGAVLLLAGEPGVGKTSGVMYCCNKVKDEVDLNHGFDVKVAKLNANDLKGINDLYEQLATALNTKPSKTSIMLKLRGKHASVKKNPPFLVLVVDEIDMMLSESDLVQTHRNSELVVKELLEYANSPELNFALIGISNSTGNNKYARLHQLGKVSSFIEFGFQH